VVQKAREIDAQAFVEPFRLRAGLVAPDLFRPLFVPCGISGTLSVISLADVDDIKIAATIRTASGSRTGALDPSSGKLYLPAAKFGPPVPPNPWPSVRPGTFAVLIVAER
jgi:hypothetical protein